MRRVILESPFGSPDAALIAANVTYAKRCMLDCLSRGDGPIASHLLWTQEGLLDDADPAQRAAGIEAGLIWGPVADAAVFYVDRGASAGMIGAAERYAKLGVRMEWRSLSKGSYYSARAYDAIVALERASESRMRHGDAADAMRAFADLQAAIGLSGPGRVIRKLIFWLGRK